MRCWSIICVGLLVKLWIGGPVHAEHSADEFFETEIRPLLAEHCWQCHGATKQWNSLRLDSAEALAHGGDSGPVVVPGHPGQSLLYQVVSRGGDIDMPPDQPLSEPQIAALRKWIEMGAPWPSDSVAPTSPDAWKSHWAFQRLNQPLPPQIASGSRPAQNAIDSFITQRLAQHDLHPTPRTDRRSLIRRATYALTGLPPAYEEVEQFASDSREDAYEHLIDRLLASPAYGQHLARTWLDVARYSDSKGYVYAREERFYVHSALYRDWVVEALNSDMPYDQFIKLQIAADQVAADEPQSLAAMGLLTLGRRFLGVTHDIIDDRIDVISRGVMGLTVGCARCHDHKYDPIPTSDYYSLYGVFQCSTDRQVDLAAYRSDANTDTEFQAELDKRLKALADKTAASRQQAADRVRSRLADYLFAQSELHKYPEEGFDVILAVDDLIPAFVRRWEAFLSRRDGASDPIFGAWFQFAALPADQFTQRAEQVIKQLAHSTVAATHPHPWIAQLFQTSPSDLRQVADRYGELFSRVNDKWKQLQETRTAGWFEEDQAWVTKAGPLLDVLYGATAPCEVPDEEVIATETFFDSGTCNELWKLQGEVDRWRLQAPQPPTVAVGLFDRDSLSDARILRRGNPANKGSRVPRQFLSLLSESPQEPFKIGSGRLELAQRVVDPSNPLTPRVWVNRLWQHCFGEGLVRTPSDFGLRAQPPSHPEVLDLLATRLIEQGWSTKAIVRMIVLSETFRQASELPQQISDDQPAVVGQHLTSFTRAFQMDPDNRLLWRVAPRRLKFEELRDSWLRVSGSLDDRPGGKATEMFTAQDTHHRRTLYGLVDRQFLPGTLRIFDFANPDLHIGRRSETLVPQQALYCLNHPFLVYRAKSLIAALEAEQSVTNDPLSDSMSIQRLYRQVVQRDPSPTEQAAAELFLAQPDDDSNEKPSVESLTWSYGYAAIDQAAGTLSDFTPLPYFTGSAWQGSAAYPDGGLGWVQLTAAGGHPGNDLQHASVRRWTAPAAMSIAIQSLAKHEPDVADGVRLQIVSSRHGLLAAVNLRADQAELNVDRFDVQAGDTIDFVVDIIQQLNSDQYLWAPVIRQVADQDADQSAVNHTSTALTVWDAARNFTGPAQPRLSRWEQLAQVLLMTNEFAFVD
ncbi:MAG: PSD1 domain-containing protein [Pirellulaceae bacterium]|nr:PSD1 domain-containing protein [Pirellulaceae bacterium]